jgi:hypothetical protein
MGNTVLNRLIMNECTKLWETIDFSGYSEKRRDGLTDEMLAGLPIRVNARYVTKNLILRDCKNVQGKGLEPLCDSMMLERVDISCARRREGELNVILLVQLLSTMIPHKLTEVDFSWNEKNHWCIKRLLYNLHAENRHEALVQRILCSNAFMLSRRTRDSLLRMRKAFRKRRIARIVVNIIVAKALVLKL